MSVLKTNLNDNGHTSRVKTTPQNVAEANEALFRATMNLPTAAAHCGMTHKEMKLTFWEYLKYHAQTMKSLKHHSVTQAVRVVL